MSTRSRHTLGRDLPPTLRASTGHVTLEIVTASPALRGVRSTVIGENPSATDAASTPERKRAMSLVCGFHEDAEYNGLDAYIRQAANRIVQRPLHSRLSIAMRAIHESLLPSTSIYRRFRRRRVNSILIPVRRLPFRSTRTGAPGKPTDEVFGRDKGQIADIGSRRLDGVDSSCSRASAVRSRARRGPAAPDRTRPR